MMARERRTGPQHHAMFIICRRYRASTQRCDAQVCAAKPTLFCRGGASLQRHMPARSACRHADVRERHPRCTAQPGAPVMSNRPRHRSTGASRRTPFAAVTPPSLF